MDLDEAADDLYGRPPEEFVVRRTELVREAKDAGDGELARAVGALRKPTVVAWLANQLSRQHPDELARLVALGESLRQATASLQGDELKALSRQRQQVVAAFVAQARAIAHAAGRRVGPDTERGLETTVAAALADGGAARRLQEGRLTDQLEIGDGFLAAAAASGGAPRASEAGTSAPEPPVDLERVRAQRAVGEAQQAERRAEVEVRGAAEALEVARRAAGDATTEVERASAALEAAAAAAERAQRAAQAAQDRSDRAELDLDDARRRRVAAEEQLDLLGG